MSNKPCAFCFVYCVLLDPCILSFRTGGDQKCPQSAWIAPILSCVRAQRWQNTRPEPLASICGWPGFRMPYLAWLRPCLTHGFWLVSVYSTFLAIKAPEHVCRLLIVSGLFNSPRFIITHNHKTSWGVKKNTANPINHLTCWNNPPCCWNMKIPTFYVSGMTGSRPRSSWFLCPPCCGRSLWDPFSRRSALTRKGRGDFETKVALVGVPRCTGYTKKRPQIYNTYV